MSTLKKIPVSVLIPAKNEEANLKSFLPSVCNQEYPNFEIVLINDASVDNSLEVMETFAQQNSTAKLPPIYCTSQMLTLC